jgi:AcrR family transcriptional regulator
MSTPDTKARLLDAAELRFAEVGFSAASLRDITTDAQANVAAANYHFGSKEGLYLAVFARRVGPLNARRLALLDAHEAAHSERPSEPLPLEPILDAFLRPALEMGAAPESRQFLRIVGRLASEMPDLCRRMEAQFDVVKQRFLASLRRALPHLAPHELFWRAHFMVGAMLHTMNDHERLAAITDGMCDARDVEGTLRQMIPCFAAGMRAPSKENAR